SDFRSGLITVVVAESKLPAWFRDEVKLQPGTIGLRCPAHPGLQALLKQIRLGCLWATSVNRSGKPPATTADEVLAWLDELRASGIDPPELVVLSRTPGSGKPSSVIDLTGDEPKRIR
ncbi:MAG: Sua5/YciO/YrdC/YwlC family protein, partial [bacterium]|nr:Sua5/YciO/YrdC/YwlC family protein [bacterium]